MIKFKKKRMKMITLSFYIKINEKNSIFISIYLNIYKQLC